MSASAPQFGPIVQNAYVVRDIDAAVAHWAGNIGVGPFFLMEHIRFGDVWFRGAPLHLDLSVAIAQWGEIQVELIVQHDTAPSIYTEFAARHGEGLQHVGVMTASVEEHLRRLAPAGIEPVQHGATANGMRFAYLSTDAHPGAMIELIESGPAVEAFFAMVRKAARGWDGARPLRRLT
ncbi:MAG: VOC family protein [Gammaproteobacteria bacterium]|nr:VOC family protein [Gammaproteobacteria bacterium]